MIRLYVFAGIIALLGSVGFFGYRFVSNIVAENSTLSANNKVLTSSLKSSADTIDSIQSDNKLQGIVLAQFQAELDSARQSVAQLQAKLAKHNIGYLAVSKPNLVETIVNKATTNINRCFAIAAGSKLTQQELNATLRSKINTECPSLANPSYRGNLK